MNKKVIIMALCLSLMKMGLFGSILHAADSKVCQEYANAAIQQYEYAKSHGCKNIRYPKWSSDFNFHYRWCLKVDEKRSKAESKYRQDYINKCTAVSDFQGHNISECQDYAKSAVYQNEK